MCLVAHPCLTLWDPMDVAQQAPLSMEFIRCRLLQLSYWPPSPEGGSSTSHQNGVDFVRKSHSDEFALVGWELGEAPSCIKAVNGSTAFLIYNQTVSQREERPGRPPPLLHAAVIPVKEARFSDCRATVSIRLLGSKLTVVR